MHNVFSSYHHANDQLKRFSERALSLSVASGDPGGRLGVKHRVGEGKRSMGQIRSAPGTTRTRLLAGTGCFVES